MFRKSLAALVALLGLAALAAAPASAHGGWLTVGTDVTGATAHGACNAGRQSYDVQLTVTLKITRWHARGTVKGVSFSTSPGGPVTVIDSDGLTNGATLPSGVSTTVFHPTVRVAVPCGTTSATIATGVYFRWSDGPSDNYGSSPARFLTPGTGVPASVAFGGLGIGAVVLGGGLLLLQRRRGASSIQ